MSLFVESPQSSDSSPKIKSTSWVTSITNVQIVKWYTVTLITSTTLVLKFRVSSKSNYEDEITIGTVEVRTLKSLVEATRRCQRDHCKAPNEMWQIELHASTLHLRSN
eukprot:g3331.t1